MLFLLAFLSIMVAGGSCGCIDGKDNVIEVSDLSAGNLAVHVQNLKVFAYTTDMKPHCKSSRPDIAMPGVLKIAKGTLVIQRPVDLKQSVNAKLTLVKDSWMVGTVCKDGLSKNVAVPNSECHVDNVCNTYGKAFCPIAQKAGSYDLEDLEKRFNFSTVIKVPRVSGFIGSMISGWWKAEIKLYMGNQLIAHIKVPSNEEWLDINDFKRPEPQPTGLSAVAAPKSVHHVDDRVAHSAASSI